FQKDHFPVVYSHGDKIAIVIEVNEPFPRALDALGSEEWQQVIAVQMDLERLGARLMTLLALLYDVRFPRHREERRQPVVVLDDVIADYARRNLPRPAY